MSDLTTTVNIYDYFRNGLIPSKRTNFPYPERNCPFCERELTLMEAIHVTDALQDFKALFICFNKDCGAYDEAAGKAYSRVYYSSNEAFEALEQARIVVQDFPTKERGLIL